MTATHNRKILACWSDLSSDASASISRIYSRSMIQAVSRASPFELGLARPHVRELGGEIRAGGDGLRHCFFSARSRIR